MSITEIKQRLSISEVLSHYGLIPDKNHMLHCPFHDDKTPSMQVYYKTNTVYCFSANCKTHAKSLDVIDFIMYKENSSKREAILRAKELITGQTHHSQAHKLTTSPTHKLPKSPTPPTPESTSLTHIAILTKMFTYFKNAVYSSSPARDYLQQRGLDSALLASVGSSVGYNSGQFHHGARRDEYLIKSCEQVGLLSPFGTNSRSGGQAYKPFAKGCICFALKNRNGQISGLYFRSTTNDKKQRHFYLKDRQGLYPKYPSVTTKQLIITESIIDAASLLQLEAINKQYSILALYGTNTLTEEHIKAISGLKALEEVIFFLNGDDAGRKATTKHAETLKALHPQLTLSTVNAPEGEDVNSLLQSHVNESGQAQPEIFTHLLEARTPLDRLEGLSFSNEKTTEQPTEKETPKPREAPQTNTLLDTRNLEKIRWEGERLSITIWGGIEHGNLHRLKLSLYLEDKKEGAGFRDEVNLYSNRSRKSFLQDASEELEIPLTELKKVINAFIKSVESYRLRCRENNTPALDRPVELDSVVQTTAIKQLKDTRLINHLKESMQEAGLIGESDNGLLLFLIFLTRFFDNPLHALVHGSSGSGKTNLLKTILGLVPPESKYITTALTENVLFRPPHKNFWQHKILLLEDLDGSYKALYPLREFMSNQYISKFASDPNPKTGKYEQVLLEAHGPVVIAGATTKDKVYEDNSNRSFLIHVDESSHHQKQILDYQNRQAAGLIEWEGVEDTCHKIHNIQRMLNPKLKVVNPFQPQLKLPEYVFKKLRTNTHYITLIQSITFLHQYQRKKKTSSRGQTYIETTLEDVALANTLSKQSLLRKSDELSGQLRSFFETLKGHVKQGNDKEENTSFLAKDIRSKLRMHPMKFSRYINELRNRGYVKKVAGKEKGSFEYRIEVWDDYQIIKKGLDVMDKVLEKLYKQYPNGEYKRGNNSYYVGNNTTAVKTQNTNKQ